jgi:hypothetical protein
VLLSFLWWRRRHDRFIPFAFFCYDFLDGPSAGRSILARLRQGFLRAILHGVCASRRSCATLISPPVRHCQEFVCGSRGMRENKRRSCHARSWRRYHPALLQSRRVLRKDRSKFRVKRYAHFKRRFSMVYDRFFRGRDSIVEQRRVAVFTSRSRMLLSSLRRNHG